MRTSSQQPNAIANRSRPGFYSSRLLGAVAARKQRKIEGVAPCHSRSHRTRRPERVSRTSLSAPYLECGRYAHQRPVVVGELAQLADDLVHLGIGCQSGANHRPPYVLHRNPCNPLALALAESGHDQPDAHIDQSGLERHPQQAYPDRRVAALLLPGNGLVELHEAIEGSVGRVANVTGEEDVFEDQATARPCSPYHCLDGPLRPRQVREEVAGEHQVVGRLLCQLLGLQSSEGHRQALFLALLTCQLQDRLVAVDANYVAFGPDEGGHLQRYIAASAPHIQATHPGSQAGRLEQRLRRRPFDSVQETQSFRSRSTAPQDVIL